MAILPNPEEQARVAPRASTNVSTYNPGNYGKTLQAEGDQLLEMAAAEGRRLDDLKATDAETQLMRREIELHAEYSKAKNDGVLATDYHKRSQEQYATTVEGIKSTLSTPAQQARFKAIADRRAVSFDASRVAYAMGEADRYEGIVYQGRVAVLEDTAAVSYSKPDVVAQSLLSLEKTFSDEMIRKGVKDPAVLTSELKNLRGNFYAKIIDSALVDNNATEANNMYAAARGMLSTEQKKAFESRLKPANDFAEGQKLAVEAQTMVAAGKTSAEVEMYVAKNASSPGAYNAAQTIYTNFQQANAKATAESEGTVIMAYHQGGSPIASKAKVLGSLEYQKLTPTQQVKVLDYIDADIQQHKAQARADVQFGWSAEAHRDAVEARKDAKAAKAEANKFKSPEAMAAFSKMITDPALKDKSRAEIWAASTAIGPALTEKVLQEQEALNRMDKPISLDKDILEAAKPASLKKDSKTASNDAYDGFVKQALMEWQAANPGKRPTVDEQQAIARSANSEYTTAGSLWGVNTHKAYEELPTGKVASEAQVKQGIIKAAAKRGLTLSTSQINDKYKKYLELNK